MSSLDLSLVTGRETIGAVAGVSGGTQISSTAANTKGTWVELTPATAAQASWIEVMIGSTATIGRYLVDIGIGAAGSEAVLLPNLHFENRQASIEGQAVYRFPVAIPAGSRVSARIQTSATTSNIRVSAILSTGDPGALTAPGTVLAYGANTGDSGLTLVTAPLSVNTESAWVELTAATSAAARWVVLAFGSDLALSTGHRFLVDLATGAGGSEVPILSDLMIIVGAESDEPNPRQYAFPVVVPSGTRLAVRAQSTNASAVLDVGAYLADAAAPAGGGGGTSAHAFAAWSG